MQWIKRLFNWIKIPAPTPRILWELTGEWRGGENEVTQSVNIDYLVAMSAQRGYIRFSIHPPGRPEEYCMRRGYKK